MQSMLPMSGLSGALRNLAIEMGKIASDIILLNSGPNTGLAEIRVPEVAPGSSIMPGKVNPSMAEAMLMVTDQVVGYDASVAWDARLGQLDLNVTMPNISFNLLDGMNVLANGVEAFRVHCIEGIEVNRDTCRGNFEASGAAATILNPIIGYKRAGDVTLTARRTGRSIREALGREGRRGHRPSVRRSAQGGSRSRRRKLAGGAEEAPGHSRDDRLARGERYWLQMLCLQASSLAR